MKIEQLMTKDVRCCRASDSLEVAAQILWDRCCGSVPVVAEDGSGKVVGMITDRDICMAAYTQGRKLSEIPVSSAMSKEVVTCAPSDSVDELLESMRHAHVRRLPVVDEASHLLGLVSITDVARDAGAKSFAKVGETLSAINQR